MTRLNGCYHGIAGDADKLLHDSRLYRLEQVKVGRYGIIKVLSQSLAGMLFICEGTELESLLLVRFNTKYFLCDHSSRYNLFQKMYVLQNTSPSRYKYPSYSLV